LTTGENWSLNHGGKGSNSKTGVFKSGGMEAEYRTAHDFVHNTGQGLMDEGQDITDIVKKICPFFYLLDPIMGNRASTR